MESLRELYKTGYGPSSSHTMGPQKAAEIFRKRNFDAASYEVELYGSLAATGKGPSPWNFEKTWNMVIPLK